MECKDEILVLPWSTIGAIMYTLIEQEGSVIQTVLNVSTQYYYPLQFFLRKYHHCGARVGPCPAEPTTKISML